MSSLATFGGSRSRLRLAVALEQAMRWEKVYRQHLTLAKLARRLGSSTHQVSEILNRDLRTTFSDYVNHYRVEEAKSLLVGQPQRAVRSIGASVGFQSLSSLNRVFKNLTGETPSEYRERHLQDPAGAAPATSTSHVEHNFRP